MAFINDHYLKLAAGYLFPEISRRVSVFAEANPAIAKEIIRCGIGDVTEPLPPAAIAAIRAAKWYKLFAQEGKASSPAVASLDVHIDFIDEFHSDAFGLKVKNEKLKQSILSLFCFSLFPFHSISLNIKNPKLTKEPRVF